MEGIYRLSAVKTPADRSKLARELFEVADKSEDESGERFVVLRKVTELAGDGGDVPLMLKAADAIAQPQGRTPSRPSAGFSGSSRPAPTTPRGSRPS